MITKPSLIYDVYPLQGLWRYVLEYRGADGSHRLQPPGSLCNFGEMLPLSAHLTQQVQSSQELYFKIKEFKVRSENWRLPVLIETKIKLAAKAPDFQYCLLVRLVSEHIFSLAY